MSNEQAQELWEELGFNEPSDEGHADLRIISAALDRARALAARRTLRVVEAGRALDPLRYVLAGLLAMDDAALLEAIDGEDHAE